MSAKLSVDLSSLDLDMQLRVFEQLRQQAAEQALYAEAQQLMAAQENQNQTYRSIDGVGGQVLAISPLAFIYYKAIEQLDFSNPRDLKWLSTRYPEMKVRSGGTKTMVGSTGKSTEQRAKLIEITSGPKRSTKTYPMWTDAPKGLADSHKA